MNLTAIPADDVATLWPQVSPGLEHLLERYSIGKWTAGEVLENLQARDWQLFVITNSDDGRIIACLICSILEGHKKTLEIGLCWGADVDSWTAQVSDALDQIGREMGCDQLALDGRPGWRKVMREFGFTLKSATYLRQINGQH